jgi:signal transduction histidine kinase
MKMLIEDLLTYSSVTFQKDEFAKVDLTEVVQQVINDLETHITEKNAVITLDRLPDVQGDKRQLTQLFTNLINNGLKYCKEDVAPIISVSCNVVDGTSSGFESADAKKKYFLIQVSDNGIGFEQEHAQRIFQVFQRLHGKQDYPGTGVGLAIVQKVVTNHHGLIAAESEPGTGSVFKILLPRHQE